MSAATAPRVLRRAAALLRRERSLWPWALVPFVLNLVAFALAATAFIANLDAIAAPLERFVEMLSFGGFALALYALPGLSFVCLAWLVTAGTLLALEVGGRRLGEGKAARRGPPRAEPASAGRRAQ
jgi:hypothetical protein